VKVTGLDEVVNDPAVAIGFDEKTYLVAGAAALADWKVVKPPPATAASAATAMMNL
jgi:hypothetical protein